MIKNMKQMIYQMNVAGHILRYRLRDPDTLRFFSHYMFPAEGDQFDIAVSDRDMAFIQKCFPEHTAAYCESKYLIEMTAVYLLRFDACIFHSAAFIWQGFAWLLAGPSGVGKTTQMIHWKRRFGDDVQIISGDMPILATQPDGSILVWPSAWNGKERWAGTTAAPLGGVIYLEQAQENTIARIGPEQSVYRIFHQYGCRPETKEQIIRLAALVERTVSQYPTWLLQNRGDDASMLLTAKTICAYLSEGSTENEAL